MNFKNKHYFGNEMALYNEKMHFEDEASLQEISKAVFNKPFDYYECLEGGYLHDTIKVYCDKQAVILQRIGSVFHEGAFGLVDNYLKIYQHLESHLNKSIYLATPRSFRNGQYIIQDRQKRFWRAFEVIEHHKIREKPLLCFLTGKAFGNYVKELSDLDDILPETLPNFHNLRYRYERYIEAYLDYKSQIAKDPLQNLLKVAHEIVMKFDYLIQHYDELINKLPLRIVHNDAKSANVLFAGPIDKISSYIIDLDTTFAGYVIVDFGDMFRSNATNISEGQINSNGQIIDYDNFKELLKGFITGLGLLLTDIETQNLLFGASWITFEVALRFLTDHLLGDKYFRTTSRGENLLRGYSQLLILSDLYKNQEKLAHLIDLQIEQFSQRIFYN